MTFRLLGIPDELRLEIEQNGGGTTEAARLIIEHAVQQAQRETELATREVQSIVGPHGSLSRIQAGGLRITPGSGMGIFTDGVHKTQIQPNGTLVIGSDIENPATTTEIFFVEDTIYNNEEFGAGDFLIGDNSEDTGNVKWDAGEGQLQFRGGTTVEAFMGTDGSLNAGGGNVQLSSGGIVILEGSGQGFLSFYDAAGTTEEFAFKNFEDVFTLISNIVGGRIDTTITLTDSSTPSYTWGENPDVDNATLFEIFPGADGGRLAIGYDHFIDFLDIDGNGSATVLFNERGHDIDFRIESATNTFAFYLDGEGEFVQFFGGTVANFDSGNSEVTLGDVLTVDYGTEKRLEIGADHYFPTRASSNPNGFWNEANQDMDFTFEGASDASLLKVDAGLNAVGMGGAAESGYKLKVTGNFKATDFSSFSAYRSTNQTIGNSSFTKVQFDTEEFDTGSYYDNATNYRFQPTVAGKYLITSCLSFPTASGIAIALLYKNGSRFKDGNTLANTALGTSTTVSSVVNMNGSSDYVEIFTFQNSGGDLNLVGSQTGSWFQGTLIR